MKEEIEILKVNQETKKEKKKKKKKRKSRYEKSTEVIGD